MSYRHQLGYSPTAKDLRAMEGGKLRISVDKSKGPRRPKVDLEIDNALGIQSALEKLSDFFTFRNMDGAGPKPKPRPKKKK